MAPWRRPHPVPGDVILRFVYAGLVVASAGLAALDFGPGIGAAWLGSIGMLLSVYATRMAFVGVFVNDEGLLIRQFWRSTVIPWRQVSGVRVEPSSIKTFLWRASPALWVSAGLVDLESPLVRGGSWLVPTFGGFDHMGRVHLAAKAFDTMVHDLQAVLAKRPVTS